MSIKAEAADLLESIDSGWYESMFESIEEAAQDDEQMAELHALLKHHLLGTDDVRSKLLARLGDLITA